VIEEAAGRCLMGGRMPTHREADTAVAMQFAGPTDPLGFPPELAWEKVPPIRFDADWQGKNADPKCETEMRLLWTLEALYWRVRARFRVLTVFADAEPNGRRDQLWDRDVAEIFLQPNGLGLREYKEFEVSPNGYWIDLDISEGKKQDLQSGLKRRVGVFEETKVWVGELSLPMKSMTARFDPAQSWRVNFYRVEGPAEPRFYSAWRPTGTPAPNFHVPEAFGKLVFVTT
jgi:alpha-galactosidase